METLKKGKADTRWVGQCKECNAIVMADSSEVYRPKDRTDVFIGDSGQGNCPDCNSKKSITFYRLNSTIARVLLRSNGLKTLYKREK